jgi:PhoPQ-activated pathogenicity-related protein
MKIEIVLELKLKSQYKANQIIKAERLIHNVKLIFPNNTLKTKTLMI